MKISVVISTYNGENYILNQLNSLLNQSLKADEVLISDDCSTDHTYDMIEDFIIKNNLQNWSINQNDKNIGWKKNFKSLINLAAGDLIFLCDQDDIWYYDKIEKMVNVMKYNNDILVLAANYKPIYQTNSIKKITNKIIKSMIFDEKVEKYCFDKLYYVVVRPGCCYCIRKTILNVIKRIWDDNYAHDFFLWTTANVMDGLYIYNYCAINFLRHENTSTGRDTYKNRIVDIENILKLDSDIITLFNKKAIDYNDNKVKVIKADIRFQKTRYKLLKKRSWVSFIKLFVYFRSYYFTNKSLLGDLYYSLKINVK